jgi:hypothetical protein
MLIQKLSQLGFIEGVDYSIVDGEIVPIAKVRLIEQEIDYPAVPEELDEEGNVIVPAREAYTEIIPVEETYYEKVPSMAEVKRLCLLDHDVALLVGEYLKDKPVTENDSLNIDLFLAGGDGWRFANVPAPTMDQLFDLIAPVQNAMQIEAEKQAKLQAGAAARKACQDVLDFIAGSNLEKNLSIEQITQLQSLFSAPEAALRAGRPTLAKQLISAITPDGVLITEEDKEIALQLLAQY